jgi:acetyl-CoA acetyltransferase
VTPADDDVVVGAVARTPFGRFNGVLRLRSGPELGAAAIDAVLERSDCRRRGRSSVHGRRHDRSRDAYARAPGGAAVAPAERTSSFRGRPRLLLR